MVRESRHLWVGNLPENIREEQIYDFFSRFGRVEKVKLLSKQSADGGKAAFVDFVDIRSATKANDENNFMGDRKLRTNYNEPSGPHGFGGGERGRSARPHGFDRGDENYNRSQMGNRGPSSGSYDHEDGFRQTNFKDDRRGMYAARKNRRDSTEGSRRSPSPRRSRSISSVSDADRSETPANNSYSSSDSETGDRSPERMSAVSQDGKSMSICVKNLSQRTSDPSLKEALFHEFKKAGEIANIKVEGAENDRFAVIKFRKADDVQNALKLAGKKFLGIELKISKWKGEDKDDGSFTMFRRRNRHNNQDDLGYDQDATRTLFVGNLEKTFTQGDLRRIFKEFGDIVDVDIKKQNQGVTTYAFLQFVDINGSMRAKKKMDREFVGRNRVKVGYGRGTPTNTLWVGNLVANITDGQIRRHFQQFGYITRVMIDQQTLQSLVSFDTIEAASYAFNEMRGRYVFGKRLMVDYASRSGKDGFYARMERTGQLDTRTLEPSPPPRGPAPPIPPVMRGGFSRRGMFDPRFPGRGGFMGHGPPPPPGRYPHMDCNMPPEYPSFPPGPPNHGPPGPPGAPPPGYYHGEYYDDFDYEKELRDYGDRQRERERESRGSRRYDYRERDRSRDRDRRAYTPLSDDEPQRSRRDMHSPSDHSDGSYYSDVEVPSKVVVKDSRPLKKRKRSPDRFYESPEKEEPPKKVEKKLKKKKEKKDKTGKKKAAAKISVDLGYDRDFEPESFDQEREEKLVKPEKTKKKRKSLDKLANMEEKARRRELKRQKKLKKLMLEKSKQDSMGVEEENGQLPTVKNEGINTPESGDEEMVGKEGSDSPTVKAEKDALDDKGPDKTTLPDEDQSETTKEEVKSKLSEDTATSPCVKDEPKTPPTPDLEENQERFMYENTLNVGISVKKDVNNVDCESADNKKEEEESKGEKKPDTKLPVEETSSKNAEDRYLENRKEEIKRELDQQSSNDDDLKSDKSDDDLSSVDSGDSADQDDGHSDSPTPNVTSRGPRTPPTPGLDEDTRYSRSSYHDDSSAKRKKIRAERDYLSDSPERTEQVSSKVFAVKKRRSSVDSGDSREEKRERMRPSSPQSPLMSPGERHRYSSPDRRSSDSRGRERRDQREVKGNKWHDDEQWDMKRDNREDRRETKPDYRDGKGDQRDFLRDRDGQRDNRDTRDQRDIREQRDARDQRDSRMDFREHRADLRERESRSDSRDRGYRGGTRNFPPQEPRDEMWRDRDRNQRERERAYDKGREAGKDRDRTDFRDRERGVRHRSSPPPENRSRTSPRYQSTERRPRSPDNRRARTPDHFRGRSPQGRMHDNHERRRGRSLERRSPVRRDYDKQGGRDYPEKRGQRDVNKGRRERTRDETPPPPPPPPEPRIADYGAQQNLGVPASSTEAKQPIVHPHMISGIGAIYGTSPTPAGPGPIPTTSGVSVGVTPTTVGYTAPPPPPQSNPDTLLDLLRRYPVMWQGLFALKNDSAAVQMHYLSGNVRLADVSLPRSPQPGEVPPPLRISQRMKLDASQLEGVNKRIQVAKDHCMLLALPCGRDPLDVHAQTRALKTGFITYLQQKVAAGIINILNSVTKQPAYVLHIFPPCEFAQTHLARVAPDLLDSAADSGHLMVLITPM